MRTLSAIFFVVLALALAACGEEADEPGTDPATEQEQADSGEAEGGEEASCEEASAPGPKEAKPGKPPKRPSGNKLTAVVETSCGTFEIALDTRGNPKTTASFEHLAKEGVYDGTWFHRIVPGFVIQGGDPNADGTGGPGYSVREAPPADAAYTQGVVAMAKTQVEPPGTSGSQFFVVTGADAGLPPDYAIVGEVSSGMDVVLTIEGFGDASDPAGTPTQAVLIERVTIEKG